MSAPKAYTTTALRPGLYRLAQTFQHPKPDRRRTGEGFATPVGFPEGTRFTIEVEANPRRGGTSGVVAYELTAPWVSGSSIVAYGVEQDGVTSWSCGDSRPEIVEALLSKLVPDTRETAWLDHALGASRYMHGAHGDVLLHLLETGRVSRQDIIDAYKTVRGAWETKHDDDE